jgi:hypothetical protein
MWPVRMSKLAFPRNQTAPAGRRPASRARELLAYTVKGLLILCHILFLFCAPNKDEEKAFRIEFPKQ